MKLRLVQLAVLVLLAVAALASPIERGPAVAGIVSSVDSAQMLVRLIDDSVTIDASQATIHDPRGAASFADIHRGAEIVAAIRKDSETGALRALEILILREAPGRIVGRIEAIDLEQQTLTVLGVRIQVTPETRFGGYVPTHDPKSLSDLRLTDDVSVEVRTGDAGLIALEVIRTGTEVLLPEHTFAGKLVAIEGDLYRIELADRRTVAVRITSETRIIGTPAVGVYVIALVSIQGPDYVARMITVVPEPPVTRFRTTGRVLEIDASSLLIRDDANRDLRFTITPLTVFSGRPSVHDRVVVIGVELAPGRLVALHVALEGMHLTR